MSFRPPDGIGAIVLVVSCAIAPFADVPKHSGWIKDISYPKAPWLHGGSSRRLNIELSRQIKILNMCPPSVEIIDHELHHKVLSPVLLIITLKYKTAGTGSEDRDVSVEKLFEAQRLIEALGEIKVSCGEEWAGKFCPARNLLHFLLLWIYRLILRGHRDFRGRFAPRPKHLATLADAIGAVDNDAHAVAVVESGHDCEIECPDRDLGCVRCRKGKPVADCGQSTIRELYLAARDQSLDVDPFPDADTTLKSVRICWKVALF